MSESDDKFWKTNLSPQPLTPEMLAEAYRLLLLTEERPSVEYHHPRCPKILTDGSRACRCGAAPLEAIFEDETSAPSEGKETTRGE